jgi:hypothetical protein
MHFFETLDTAFAGFRPAAALIVTMMVAFGPTLSRLRAGEAC